MKKNKRYTQKRQFIIYALIRNGYFFVGITEYSYLPRIVSEKINCLSHVCHRYMYDTHEKPCVFQLSVENQTITDAYRIKLSWIRILSEHGFICIDKSAQMDADAMFSTTYQVYEHQAKRYDEVIRCGNCLMSNNVKLCQKVIGGTNHETYSNPS